MPTGPEHRLDDVIGYYRTGAPDGYAAFGAMGRTKRLTDHAEIEEAKAKLEDAKA